MKYLLVVACVAMALSIASIVGSAYSAALQRAAASLAATVAPPPAAAPR